MKKFIVALLVLTMVLALAGSAMAATRFVKGELVILKKNSTAYSEPKSSKATKSVAEKGSVAEVVRECGNYVKVRVAQWGEETTYFKKCNLAHYKNENDGFSILVFWVKGGKGMSSCGDYYSDDYFPEMTKVKVIAHTNLRKNPGMKCKSQGVVEKGDVLKYKGRLAYDDRGVGWYKICYKGKILWISHHFCTMPYCRK